MAKTGRSRGWSEAVLAVLMLLSFYMPWLYSMGAPIRALEIRERLAGPHKLFSAFSAGSRVSRDYELSAFLYAVPVLAGLVVLLVILGRYRSWMGFLAGAAALAAFVFLRGEVKSFPFHRLASGSYVALAAGAALAMSPLVRIGSRFRS